MDVVSQDLQPGDGGFPTPTVTVDPTGPDGGFRPDPAAADGDATDE